MKKDLLKLIVTATLATLFIGCGSSGKSTPTATATATATATSTATPTAIPTATATPTATPTADINGSDINDTSNPLPF